MPSRRTRQKRALRELLHGFDTATHANAYLSSGLFERDVFGALRPLIDGPADVRVYTVI